MSKPKSAAPAATSTDLPAGDAPVKRTRGPRKSKITQPAWYVAELADGTFRLIEDMSPEAVKDRLLGPVVIRPAFAPDDFVKAGSQNVALEHKPIAAE